MKQIHQSRNRPTSRVDGSILMFLSAVRRVTTRLRNLQMPRYRGQMLDNARMIPGVTHPSARDRSVSFAYETSYSNFKISVPTAMMTEWPQGKGLVSWSQTRKKKLLSFFLLVIFSSVIYIFE